MGSDKIIAVLEPRSNTMRLGIHANDIAASLANADEVLLFEPDGLGWSLQTIVDQCPQPTAIYSTVEKLIAVLSKTSNKPTHILIMSNGAFGGIHQKLIVNLKGI